MLAFIPAEDRDLWVRMAMAMQSKFGDDGLAAWLVWSATADNYNERDALAVWRSISPDGGVSFGSLIREARHNGWNPGGPMLTTAGEPRRSATPPTPPWLACLPVPAARADDFARLRHPDFGKPKRWWRYEGSQGELMYAVARFEGPRGKEIRPASFGTDGTGRTGWRWRRPQVLIPWNLPTLYARPGAPVLICEGEKAAEAAQRLLPGYVVTCGHGGAEQPHKTHWGHLARRDCLLWPDDDQASVEVWTPRLARILLDLDARVRIVDPSRLWRAVA